MPEGPAVGRVEAKRRALTTPSTAPASKRDGAGKIRLRERDVLPGRQATRANRLRRIRRPLCPGEYGHEHVHAGGAFVLHDLCAQTATCGHDQRWRERPRLDALGSPQGRTAGSFTPSLVQRLRHRLRQ